MDSPTNTTTDDPPLPTHPPRAIRFVQQAAGAEGKACWFAELWDGSMWRYVPGTLAYNKENAEAIFNRMVATKQLEPEKIVLREEAL